MSRIPFEILANHSYSVISRTVSRQILYRKMNCLIIANVLSVTKVAPTP